MDKTSARDEREKLLGLIKNGDQGTLQQLYEELRRPFMVWATQILKCPDEDGLEIYQRSFTVLYLNIRNGKLTVLTSSLKTYLFAIGRNIHKEWNRGQQRYAFGLDHNEELDDHLDFNIFEQQQGYEHQKEVVRRLLQHIGEPCKTLMDLIYLQGYSYTEVVQELQYSNEQVARKRKCMCLKKLREALAANPHLL
jgi:RNA polymerase sigma factor (sigma-70 family)